MLMAVPGAAFSLLIAASWAGLPSMVGVAGTPWRRRAWGRNRGAAGSSRSAVRRHARVWPVFSTARARAYPRPLLLLDVASMRQLPPRALPPGQRLCPRWTVWHDPALAGRVVDRAPALLQEGFDMTIAQGLRHRPAHAHHDALLWDMGPFATDRPRLASP